MSVRQPISRNILVKPFDVGERETVLTEEKLLADFTNKRVIARGEKGNMFFVD